NAGHGAQSHSGRTTRRWPHRLCSKPARPSCGFHAVDCGADRTQLVLLDRVAGVGHPAAGYGKPASHRPAPAGTGPQKQMAFSDRGADAVAHLDTFTAARLEPARRRQEHPPELSGVETSAVTPSLADLTATTMRPRPRSRSSGEFFARG